MLQLHTLIYVGVYVASCNVIVFAVVKRCYPLSILWPNNFLLRWHAVIVYAIASGGRVCMGVLNSLNLIEFLFYTVGHISLCSFLFLYPEQRLLYARTSPSFFEISM